MSGFNSISSGFGPRNAVQGSRAPISSNHMGIDVRMPVGTPIRTNVPLTYIGTGFSSQSGNAGLTASFRDNSGQTHQLLHLNQNSNFTPGQQIAAGDTIAISGASGNITGPHLDYRVKNTDGTYVNPMSINPETGRPYAGNFSPGTEQAGLGGTARPEDAPTTGAPLPGGQPGGQGGRPQGAAGAGGQGGGPQCAGAGVSAAGMMGIGGLMQGLGMGLNQVLGGLTQALQQLPGVAELTQAFNQATAMIGQVGQGLNDALNTVTQGAFAGLSQMGADLAPGLTNVIPAALNNAGQALLSPITSVLQNPLSLPSVVQQFTAAGGLGGFVNQVGKNMVGDFAGGTIANLTDNLMNTSAIASIARSVVGGTGEAMQQTFGNGIGGVGEMIRNTEGLISYGVSTLGNNIAAVSSDMLRTGSWSTENLTRLMSPGAIAGQILSAGLGNETGLTTALTSAGIPILGVDSPLNDEAVSKVLASITNPAAIAVVQDQFGVSANLNNLAELTDINKMMPGVAKTLPVNSFESLGQELIKLQITQAPTMTDIAVALSKMESGRDLNNISQLETPMHKPTGDMLMKSFGFGGGTYGEIVPGNFMGTPAGIVHNDTIPVIMDNITFLKSHPDSQEYFEAIDKLNRTLAGEYTIQGEYEELPPPVPGDPIIEPEWIDGSIVIPDVGTYSSMDAALGAMVAFVELKLRVLLASTDPKVKVALDRINLAHTASISQVLREGYLLDTYDMSVFEPKKMTPVNAYVFVKSLESISDETGYGQAADLINRLASPNLYGDSLVAIMRQERNARILQPLGVNTERVKVPTSDYYRAPLDYVSQVYFNNLPDRGTYAQPTAFPTDNLEKYLVARDATLHDAGYADAELTPAQKDELYYDQQWVNNNDYANRMLGEAVINEALARNLMITGDSIEIFSLGRARIRIGTLKNGKLVDYDYSAFITNMFDIINKILYGDIGTTKNTNPLSTDELVYQIADMLKDVTTDTVEFLMTTYIGSTVLAEFLKEVHTKFTGLGTINDTQFNRNDPNTWGGAGVVET